MMTGDEVAIFFGYRADNAFNLRDTSQSSINVYTSMIAVLSKLTAGCHHRDHFRKAMKLKTPKGFTLIELVVTVTIAGILAAIAIPSFISIINNNRLTASANDLVTAFNLARSEAIKRGIQVTVRRKGANLQQWESGWDVFVDSDNPPDQNPDNNGNGTLCEAADGCTLLRTYDALPSGFTLRTVDNPATTYQTYAAFLPSGLSKSTDIGTFTLCSGSGNPMPQRTIVMNATGRPRVNVASGNCP
jgi:type IV fimbrial biogenesis protein FimT